jgi:hypothetical protein
MYWHTYRAHLPEIRALGQAAQVSLVFAEQLVQTRHAQLQTIREHLDRLRAARVPSGLNATARTLRSWSSRDIWAPVAASNTRALPSTSRSGPLTVTSRDIPAMAAAPNIRAASSSRNGPLPVATRVPSGLNATACTSSPWSRRLIWGLLSGSRAG